MVGKVVAVCIALLFIVVLAFPVANSLSNMGGNDGGSGEDELQKTVINSWEGTFGQGIISTKYKSYDYYLSSETPTLPHEISYTLEDFRAMMETFNSSPNGYLFITHNEDFSEDLYIKCRQNNIYLESKSLSVKYAPITSLNISVSTDYTVTYSVTYTDTNTNTDKTSSGSFTAVEVRLLSESEYGWVLNIDVTVEQLYIANGCGLSVVAVTPNGAWVKIIVLTQDMFSSDTVQFTVDWGEGYHSDVTIPIQSTATEGVWQIAWDEDNYEGIPVKDSSGTEVEGSDVIFNGITTYGYVSSDNNTIINVGEHYYTPRENSRIDYLFRVVDGMYEISSSPDLGSVEPVVVTHIPYVEENRDPYLCLAFGEGGSLWLSQGGNICMARSGEYGTTVIPQVQITSASISETGEYDSHTYGNMYGLDYYLAVDGTYVYSENHPKASLTDTIYISAPTFYTNDRPVSVHSFGTPQNALDNIAGNYDTTVTNVDAHYTVGDYVTIDSVDVSYTIDGNSGEMTVSGFFVPKEFTYEPSDSDSGSGSGIDGVASTLIKLVPILLIVSLLLVFIVPMVYKPN
jgi:hypothetical protein